MFRQAVFSDEVSQNLLLVIAVCRFFRLLGIELRSVWGYKAPQDIPKEKVLLARDMLASNGLQVCSIASPFFKCDIDSAEEIAAHLDILKRCAELAHALDVIPPIVRGFTFWRKKDVPYAEVEPRIIDIFGGRVFGILEEHDIILGIENEASTFIGTGRRLADFLQKLNHPRVGAIWDPCNVVYVEGDAGEEKEKPYPDGYKAIRPRIVHVHIKDTKPNERGEQECCPIGEGDVNFVDQYRALLEDSYNGWTSLETHWRPRALTREQVDKPGGEDYSARAAEASVICLQNIAKIIEQVRPPISEPVPAIQPA